jgi:ribose 1,5-bisphosphokinase PhnN
VQIRDPPDALRLEIRGRPVWLMITARAAREPRSSQNVTVAVTPICPNGRKDRVLRLDEM